MLAVLRRRAQYEHGLARGRRRPIGFVPARQNERQVPDPKAIAGAEERKRPWENQDLKARIQKRMPHLDEDTHPLYRRYLGGSDKIVIPGAGTTWLKKAAAAETMDLRYDFNSWDRLQEPYKNIKLFTLKGILSSDVLRRLSFPDLAAVGTVATLISVFNVWFAPAGDVISGISHVYHFELHYGMIIMPCEPILILGLAIGLLMNIRLQVSYARFSSGRQLWGLATANSRELCGRIMARVPTPSSAADKHPAILAARNQGAKLAWTFPHALRYHITWNGCNVDMESTNDSIYMTPNQEAELVAKQHEQKRARLREELQLIWDFNDPGEMAIIARLLHRKTRNWPQHVLQELTHLNGNQYVAPHPGGLGQPNSDGVDQRILALQQILSDAERIYMTPVYTPYTRFTNRVIYMFIMCLPPVLYPLAGPWLTPPISVYLAFVLLGTDDIGRRVEEPFDNLPLWQFCETVDESCMQIMKSAKKFEKSSITARGDGWTIGWSGGLRGDSREQEECHMMRSIARNREAGC